MTRHSPALSAACCSRDSRPLAARQVDCAVCSTSPAEGKRGSGSAGLGCIELLLVCCCVSVEERLGAVLPGAPWRASSSSSSALRSCSGRLCSLYQRILSAGGQSFEAACSLMMHTLSAPPAAADAPATACLPQCLPCPAQLSGSALLVARSQDQGTQQQTLTLLLQAAEPVQELPAAWQQRQRPSMHAADRPVWWPGTGTLLCRFCKVSGASASTVFSKAKPVGKLDCLAAYAWLQPALATQETGACP